MPAPKGNKFWEARAKHGRERIFSTPDDLWNAAIEYFNWVEENPLYEDELVKYQGAAEHESVAKMRAMTDIGFCNFVQCDLQTLDNYGSKIGYEDFFGVVSRIKSIIRQQKFEGAAANMLNPNIIARDLGLKDESKVDSTSSDGSMSPQGNAYDQEMYKEAQSKLNSKLK
jgi:hypothetical protein